MNMLTKLTKQYDDGKITWEEYAEKARKVQARHNKVINERKTKIINSSRAPKQQACRDRLFGKP